MTLKGLIMKVDFDSLLPYLEKRALEPVLSQNITQSQMPINNQTITIIIKSKYYRISLAISIFGCIFGCRISNTPSQERSHPYACHIRKPPHRVYNWI